MTSRRGDSLDRIARDVVSCRLCPRLREHCRRVAAAGRPMFRGQTYWGRPVPGFGDAGAALLVVGLAPAAHGGNRTGRIFTGDRSGDWLFAALHRHGFASQPRSTGPGDGMVLRGVYISAAARCAPPDNRPTPEEFSRCSPFLVRELRQIRSVRVVLCLGALALAGFRRARQGLGLPVAPGWPRFAHGAEWTAPEGIALLCSYHPSQQNTLTGRLTGEMFDAVFRRAGELLQNRFVPPLDFAKLGPRAQRGALRSSRGGIEP